MNVKKAIEMAEKETDKGYFLISCFISLPSNKWVLHYYNPKKETSLDITVDNKTTRGGETPAIKKFEKLEQKKVATTLEEILEKIKSKSNKKMAILHQSNGPKWTIIITNPNLTVRKINFDAKNGNKMDEETISLTSELKGK